MELLAEFKFYQDNGLSSFSVINYDESEGLMPFIQINQENDAKNTISLILPLIVFEEINETIRKAFETSKADFSLVFGCFSLDFFSQKMMVSIGDTNTEKNIELTINDFYNIADDFFNNVTLHIL